MGAAMAKKTKARIGRPPRRIPRHQKLCYMQADTIERIKQFQDREVAAGRECCFSDAVERMVRLAVAATSDRESGGGDVS